MDATRAIVCIDHSPRIGGATRVLLTALDALDRSAYRAIVVCNAGGVGDAFAAAGHEVETLELPILTFSAGPRSLASMLGRFVRASAAIARIARASKAVALYAHGLASALYAARAAVLVPAPLVWHVHEMLDHRARMRPFVWAAAAAARRIVCVSRASAARVESLGAPRAKCGVVYNGVPAPLSPAPKETGPAVGSLVGREPLLVVVGALTPGKGQDVLVEAMADIAQSHPRAAAVIVGEPLQEGDREYVERIRRRIGELGVADRVRLVGFRQDVAALLRDAAVVVHPSTREEAFGLVPLEAMALGRPVVATAVGGIPEVIEDGRTGILVAPGDARAIASAVRALLDSPELRARMGAEGHRRARERFGTASAIAGLNDAFGRAAWLTPFIVPEDGQTSGAPPAPPVPG